MDKFHILSKDNINELPKTSGVYCFIENNNYIYIGKAVNIKDRVKNHFNQPSYRDNLFIGKVEKIGFINTDSEIEALILEANLIKKYQPRFNVVWRDDKNYFYVAIGENKHKTPYLFITHQIKESKTNYIGPFVEGNALKKTLKFLRRVFPYYTAASHPKNKCTWCHLELCPGPVRNTARADAPEGPLGRAVSNGAGPTLNLPEYKKNIKKLILVLKGKRKTVLNLLKKEMKTLSNGHQFEKAAKIRDKMHALEQVMLHTKVITQGLEGPSFQSSRRTGLPEFNTWEKIQTILQGLLGIKNPISNIECYDISNIQGKYATGSMVVFTNGKPDKSQYKKFKIRMKNEPNDIAMLKEVLTRRLAHPEWQYPEIMLIDGGIAQLNIAIQVKNDKKETYNIKVISIAKRFKELHIEGRLKPILLKTLPQEIYNLIIALDDEAHRFAITYHKKLRKKSLLT